LRKRPVSNKYAIGVVESMVFGIGDFGLLIAASFVYAVALLSFNIRERVWERRMKN
jgi:hypothetical protein